MGLEKEGLLFVREEPLHHAFEKMLFSRLSSRIGLNVDHVEVTRMYLQ